VTENNKKQFQGVAVEVFSVVLGVLLALTANDLYKSYESKLLT